MKNFQAVLDAAVGTPAAQRPPQGPSDVSKERDRALVTHARRTERLRQSQLGSSEEGPLSLVFEVDYKIKSQCFALADLLRPGT